MYFTSIIKQHKTDNENYYMMYKVTGEFILVNALQLFPPLFFSWPPTKRKLQRAIFNPRIYAILSFTDGTGNMHVQITVS